MPLPDEAKLHPGARQANEALAATGAVHRSKMTGRPLAFMKPRVDSGVDLYCSYSLETRLAGVEWQHPELEAWSGNLTEVAEKLKAAVSEVGGELVESSRVAMNKEVLYLEHKPFDVVVHTGPARSANPDAPVDRWLREAIDRLEGDYCGLSMGDNNGNMEFEASLSPDAQQVEKGVAVADQEGTHFVMLADDSRDISAAVETRNRGGLVFVVNHPADSVRRGTPAALVDVASRTFESVTDLAKWNYTLARQLSRDLGLKRSALSLQ